MNLSNTTTVILAKLFWQKPVSGEKNSISNLKPVDSLG